MARVTLPFPPVAEGDRCPTCNQITGQVVGSFFGGSDGGKWGYAVSFTGGGWVDPGLVHAPAIDEAAV